MKNITNSINNLDKPFEEQEFDFRFSGKELIELASILAEASLDGYMDGNPELQNVYAEIHNLIRRG